GYAEIERELAHPFAGSLGSGRIQNHVDQVLPRLRILGAENIASDLDEVAVELAAVPLIEDSVELVIREAQGATEHEIGFADQLHVAVLDAVVDHLHVMPGA